MPRIPPRTVPYAPGQQQQRHFRNKRDTTLKFLSKASYINNSQFAILWVTATGEVEAYSSSALEPFLTAGEDGLFPPAVLAKAVKACKKVTKQSMKEILAKEPAEAATTAAPAPAPEPENVKGKGKRTTPTASDDEDEADDMDLSLDVEEEPEDDETMEQSVELTSPAGSALADSSGRPLSPVKRASVSPAKRARIKPSPSVYGSPIPNRITRRTRGPNSPLSRHASPAPSRQDSASPVVLPAIASTATTTAPIPRPVATMSLAPPPPTERTTSDESVMTTDAPTPSLVLPKPSSTPAIELRRPPLSMAAMPSVGVVGLAPVMRSVSGNSSTSSNSSSSGSRKPSLSNAATFTTPATLCAFLEEKFGQLQMSSGKLLAKAWMKLVEPKKQSHFPYSEGDPGRPPWWPLDVEHKDPDGLSKRSRIRLLMVMLGCGRVPIVRLETAALELATKLKSEKMAILKDIFKVAKEEERLRVAHPHLPFQPFTVELAPSRSVYGYEGMPESSIRPNLASRPPLRARSSEPLSRRPSAVSPLMPSDAVLSPLVASPAEFPASAPPTATHFNLPPSVVVDGKHLGGARFEGGLLTPQTGGMATVESFPGPRPPHQTFHSFAPSYDPRQPSPQHLPGPSFPFPPQAPPFAQSTSSMGQAFTYPPPTNQLVGIPSPADSPWQHHPSGFPPVVAGPAFFSDPFGFPAPGPPGGGPQAEFFVPSVPGFDFTAPLFSPPRPHQAPSQHEVRDGQA